jgi:hypothetical protein
MKRSLIALAAALGVLAACDGFKEAMTAHVDVVARAGSQELSVDRLSELLGNSKAQLSPDVARAVAKLWVNYQLLGEAAAKNDSLKDPKLIDEAMWPIIAQERANKWHDMVAKTWTGLDTTATEAKYNQGNLLAAQHILFMVPENGFSQHQKDSVKALADKIHSEVNGSNFAAMAKKYSMDGTKDRGGSLGVFPRGVMVKEFDNALLALKPGEISPVVQTQFGYHIIRRLPYNEAKDEFAQTLAQTNTQGADSAYLAGVQRAGNIQIKDNAAATIKAAAKDFDAHRKDNTVIATSKAGDLTLSRFLQWLDGFPQRQRIEAQIPQAPDTSIREFVKGVLTNELVLRQADSAKVEIDPKELSDLRARFVALVGGIWTQLGVSPKLLADSAKTPTDREKVAATQIDRYMDKLLANQAQFVDVPAPVEVALHDRFDWKMNTAGLDRAVERATSIRRMADSTRAAQRPQSQVPIQMAPQGGQPMQPAPAPSSQPATKPPATKPPATTQPSKP